MKLCTDWYGEVARCSVHKLSWCSQTLGPSRVSLNHDFALCTRATYCPDTKWWFTKPRLPSKPCALVCYKRSVELWEAYFVWRVQFIRTLSHKFEVWSNLSSFTSNKRQEIPSSFYFYDTVCGVTRSSAKKFPTELF